ncbi:hypothetical protein KIPB_011105, partial [Kipferlia bialata]|eukprot:g11105.t1
MSNKPELYCSVCARLLEPLDGQVITSCGHFICSHCLTFEPGERIECPVCKKGTDTVALNSN